MDNFNENNWQIENMQIFDKIIALREKMSKKWGSMLLAVNLKNNQFLVEYYAGIETSWRKACSTMLANGGIT